MVKNEELNHTNRSKEHENVGSDQILYSLTPKAQALLEQLIQLVEKQSPEI